MRRCFDNREEDIGGFIRRHLSSPESVAAIQAFLSGTPAEAVAPTPARSPACAFLEEGNGRYRQRLISTTGANPSLGAWAAAAVCQPSLPADRPTRQFLTSVLTANPNLTGWPVWVDSRGFHDADCRPYVADGGWESWISGRTAGTPAEPEFWRIEPAGRLYLRRVLQDDLRETERSPEPGTALDPYLMTLRVAEALAVAPRLLEAAGAKLDAVSIGWCLQWTGLRGRHLETWSSPLRPYRDHAECREETVLSEVLIPGDVAGSGLVDYVHALTEPLYASFGGEQFDVGFAGELVRKVVERRW